MTRPWKVIKAEPHHLSVQDPDGWYEADVKWDGCIHFHQYSNVPLPRKVNNKEQLHDYLHICDIDDIIKRLTQLKAVAQQHFGKDWPK